MILRWEEKLTFTAGQGTSYAEKIIFASGKGTSTSEKITFRVQAVKDAFAVSPIKKVNKILVDWTGTADVDESTYLIDMLIKKEMEYETGSIEIGNVSANSLTFKMNNVTQRFNSLNTSSPIYQYLKANKKVTPYIGIIYGGITYYVEQGIFYIKQIIPRTNMMAEFKCVDMMGLMKEKDFETSELYEGDVISDLVKMIVEDFGIVAADYSIDVTTETIDYAYFNKASYAYHIKQLAIAEGGMAYFDNAGKFQFKNRSYEPSYDIQKEYDNNIILKGTLNKPYIAKKMKNKVQIRSRPLVLTEQKIIFESSETLAVPAGGTLDVSCFFISSPCSAIQGATFTQSGADITITAENKYQYATFLTFTNAGGAQNVTSIEIQGRPLVSKGQILAEAENAALIVTYGEKIYTIDNPYIQDYPYAKSLADAQLAVWKDPEAEISFKALSLPFLELGQRALITSPKLNINVVQYQIAAITIDYKKSIIDTIKLRKCAQYFTYSELNYQTGQGDLTFEEYIIATQYDAVTKENYNCAEN